MKITKLKDMKKKTDHHDSKRQTIAGRLGLITIWLLGLMVIALQLHSINWP